MHEFGPLTARARNRIAFAFLACALSVAALAGGATTGHAASTAGIVVTGPTVLNDDGLTIPGQPSPGGNIGYSISVANTGTSTANHVSISETLDPAGKLVYINSTGITCPAVNPAAPTTSFSCQITKLNPGNSFSITALFQTSSTALPGSTVTNHIVVDFDSQTNGPPNTQDAPLRPCEDRCGSARQLTRGIPLAAWRASSQPSAPARPAT